MKTERTEYSMSEDVKIFPFKDDPSRDAITVSISRSWTTRQWGPSGINFSCFGRIDPEYVKEFADGLMFAISIAEELNQKYGVQTTT